MLQIYVISHLVLEPPCAAPQTPEGIAEQPQPNPKTRRATQAFTGVWCCRRELSPEAELLSSSDFDLAFLSPGPPVIAFVKHYGLLTCHMGGGILPWGLVTKVRQRS